MKSRAGLINQSDDSHSSHESDSEDSLELIGSLIGAIKKMEMNLQIFMNTLTIVKASYDGFQDENSKSEFLTKSLQAISIAKMEDCLSDAEIMFSMYGKYQDAVEGYVSKEKISSIKAQFENFEKVFTYLMKEVSVSPIRSLVKSINDRQVSEGVSIATSDSGLFARKVEEKRCDQHETASVPVNKG